MGQKSSGLLASLIVTLGTVWVYIIVVFKSLLAKQFLNGANVDVGL
ncbi:MULTISPECIES: hypothetical protein [Methylomonas]|nr:MULTISPECIES: hypothetical protein [Methylomonas]